MLDFTYFFTFSCFKKHLSVAASVILMAANSCFTNKTLNCTHISKRQLLVWKVSFVKGATKLYFTHYSCVIVVLLNTASCRSAFSTVFLENFVFLCFLWSKALKYASSWYIVSFSPYKNSPFINNKFYSMLPEMLWVFFKKISFINKSMKQSKN